MENTFKGNMAPQDADSQHDWQHAENNDQWSQAGANEDEALDLRSAEAGGYGTDDEDDTERASGSGTNSYDNDSDDDDDRDDDSDDDDDDDNDADDADDDDDDDDSDDDTPDRDWGDIDPQANHGPFPSSNDPSGPGSAV